MEKEINNIQEIEIGIANAIILPPSASKERKDYYINESKEWCLNCIKLTITKDPNPQIWDIDNTQFTIKEEKNKLVITARTPKKKL